MYILLADDAMISLKYAQNLIHHGQLVWNLGEKVMGITNPGWTLIMAGTMLLPIPRNLAGLPVAALGLIINLALIYIIYQTLTKSYGNSIAFLLSLWLGVYMPLVFWSVHGFETAAQTLFIAAATIKILPPKISGEKTIAALPYLWAAYIIRPDAALFIALLSVAALILNWNSPLRKKAILFVCLSGAIILGTLIAQKLYYGDWLPNTYYLKSTGGAKSIAGGVVYFAKSLWSDGILPIFALAVLGIYSWLRQKSLQTGTLLMAAMIAIWSAYIIWTGGDAFPHARFFMPAIPALIFAAAEGIEFILITHKNPVLHAPIRNAGQMLFACAVGIFFGLLMLWQVANYPDFFGPDKNRVDRVAVAQYLEKLSLPPGTKIAVFEAGTIPFLLPDFRYIDLLGKNDRHIARTKAHPGLIGHNKWDFDYSLGKLKPDIICARDKYENFPDSVAALILANAEKFPKNSVFFPSALWIHPEFVRHYRKNRLPIKTPFGTHWTFARDEFFRNHRTLRAQTPFLLDK